MHQTMHQSHHLKLLSFKWLAAVDSQACPAVIKHKELPDEGQLSGSFGFSFSADNLEK
jgi:hypothetical protein